MNLIFSRSKQSKHPEVETETSKVDEVENSDHSSSESSDEDALSSITEDEEFENIDVSTQLYELFLT